jgi:hypothetical protein
MKQVVTGGCRKLYNEELHTFQSLPAIIRAIKWIRMRRVGDMTRTRDMRSAHKILVGNLNGHRCRCRWEDNIKTYIKEIWREVMDWFQLLPNRGQWRALVNMIMKPSVSREKRNSFTNWVTISFSRRVPLYGVSVVRHELNHKMKIWMN